MRRGFFAGLLFAGTTLSTPAAAQQAPSVQARLDRAMAMLEAQAARLDAQERELAALRGRLEERERAPQIASPAVPPVAAAQASAAATPGDPASVQQAPLERVGQAPVGEDRPIELAVLDSQGSVVTRRGQLAAELQLDYARADRNRAVFRGIELVEAVLVGVFDINESRQDVLTASGSLRYGLTNRLEVGARLPYIYRADTSIIAPISGSTQNDADATIDNSTKGNGIGDLELTARYQLIDGREGSPYVIGNLQAVFPTGDNPFQIPRDDLGRATRAATGAGFYGITPSLTAVLPSDPIVLFGTLGYTFNLARDVSTRIPPIIIERVDPGDAISGSAGVGIAFNERSTLNFGYAHSWILGTETLTRLIEPTPAWPGLRSTTSRDLQIGRFLFGVTYRASDRTSVNWSVEVGATEDATDLRTVLRVPLLLLTGG